MGLLLLCVLSLVAFVYPCEHHSEEIQYTFTFTFNIAPESFDVEQVNNGICASINLDLSQCSASSLFANPSTLESDKTTYEFTIDGHHGDELAAVVSGKNGLDILSKNVGYSCNSWYSQKNAGEKLATRFLPDVTSQQPDSNSTYVNLASIPSNFDIQTRLVPAWQLGENGEPAPGNAPDVVGAFRFLCQAGHLAYDDPIVYPGQPGKSHLHQFFGNTETNAFSSYQSLRTSGNSTCMNDLNRSGYWIPAMFDGKGNVVKPEFVSIYYKRLPNTSPDCFTQGAKGCIPIPRGLRYVFGYDLVTNTTPTGGGYFNCDGPVGQCVAGHFSTITEAAANCAPGCKIGAVINAPDCWDGKRLDSPGHREHMANFGYGDWGYPKCPDTHPYVIPTFTLGAWYPVSDDRADTWFLSSDIIPGKPQLKAGESFHADWFGAWDDNILDGFENGCINDFLNCNTGNLGNYLQLKQISQDDGIRVVPIPERPL